MGPIFRWCGGQKLIMSEFRGQFGIYLRLALSCCPITRCIPFLVL
jgi:hypothetical protein